MVIMYNTIPHPTPPHPTSPHWSLEAVSAGTAHDPDPDPDPDPDRDILELSTFISTADT